MLAKLVQRDLGSLDVLMFYSGMSGFSSECDISYRFEILKHLKGNGGIFLVIQYFNRHYGVSHRMLSFRYFVLFLVQMFSEGFLVTLKHIFVYLFVIKEEACMKGELLIL